MLGLGLSVLIPVIGGYLYQSQRVDEKVEERIGIVSERTTRAEERIDGISERTAKIEEAVETIKKDNAETRQDIKNFLRELNNKKK